MSDFLRDLGFGLRTLRRNPAFAAIAALTIALGIGVNTTVFSLVNGVLLRPFPFEEPERIVVVASTRADNPTGLSNLSYPDFADIEAQSSAFEEIAVWDWEPFNLRGEGEPVFVPGAHVSAGFFDVVGVRPLLGRTFRSEEDRPGGPEVLLLSEQLWREQFGGDPEVVGETVTLHGVLRTVIGVMPGSLTLPDDSRLWVPLGLDAETSSRGRHWLGGLARLAPGATLEEARAELSTIAARLEAEYPDTNRDRGLTAVTLREDLTGEIRPVFLILLGSVLFVLLIACANVANLLLARASAREREIAARVALGAGRGRIVRQLLTEGLALGLVGAALGYLLGQWGVDAIVRLVPEEVPGWIQLQADARVLAFTAGVSLLAVALFALPPALQASRPDLNRSLKDASLGTTAGLRRHRLRAGLVISQVALSLTLLVGAGLMIRSFLRLAALDPGFQTEDRLLASMALPFARYSNDADRVEFAHRVVERVGGLPGVSAAGIVSRFPLRGSSNSMSFTVEGQTQEEYESNRSVLTNSADPAYFGAAGIPLVRGRLFDERDRAGAPPVGLVNDEFARRYWPDDDPLGKRLKFGGPEMGSDWIEVVGVVGSVRHFGMERRPGIQLYLPFDQSPSSRINLVVHAASDPAALLPAIRGEIAAIDPDQALYDVMTLERVVARSIWEWKFFAALFWIFGVLAATLAAVGLYGVLSYLVTQRTREIGIRVAMGAERAQVVRMVLGQGVTLVLVGLTAGFALGLGMGRVMSGILYEIDPADPATLAVVSGLLGAVALLAVYVPARRASRVDPMVALRYE